jgi:hypothetical protein
VSGRAGLADPTRPTHDEFTVRPAFGHSAVRSLMVVLRWTAFWKSYVSGWTCCLCGVRLLVCGVAALFYKRDH